MRLSRWHVIPSGSCLSLSSTQLLLLTAGGGRHTRFLFIASSATPSSDLAQGWRPEVSRDEWGTVTRVTLLATQQAPRPPLLNVCSEDFRENMELLLNIFDSHCALLQDMYDGHLYSHINLKVAFYNSNMMWTTNTLWFTAFSQRPSSRRSSLTNVRKRTGTARLCSQGLLAKRPSQWLPENCLPHLRPPPTPQTPPPTSPNRRELGGAEWQVLEAPQEPLSFPHSHYVDFAGYFWQEDQG